MAMADWAVFGCFLLVAGLVGWLAIRHLARRDQETKDDVQRSAPAQAAEAHDL